MNLTSLVSLAALIVGMPAGAAPLFQERGVVNAPQMVSTEVFYVLKQDGKEQVFRRHLPDPVYASYPVSAMSAPVEKIEDLRAVEAWNGWTAAHIEVTRGGMQRQLVVYNRERRGRVVLTTTRSDSIPFWFLGWDYSHLAYLNCEYAPMGTCYLEQIDLENPTAPVRRMFPEPVKAAKFSEDMRQVAVVTPNFEPGHYSISVATVDLDEDFSDYYAHRESRVSVESNSTLDLSAYDNGGGLWFVPDGNFFIHARRTENSTDELVVSELSGEHPAQTVLYTGLLYDRGYTYDRYRMAPRFQLHVRNADVAYLWFPGGGELHTENGTLSLLSPRNGTTTATHQITGPADRLKMGQVSPDGRSFYFIRSYYSRSRGNLERLDFDTGAVTALTDDLKVHNFTIQDNVALLETAEKLENGDIAAHFETLALSHPDARKRNHTFQYRYYVMRGTPDLSGELDLINFSMQLDVANGRFSIWTEGAYNDVMTNRNALDLITLQLPDAP